MSGSLSGDEKKAKRKQKRKREKDGEDAPPPKRAKKNTAGKKKRPRKKPGATGNRKTKKTIKSSRDVQRDRAKRLSKELESRTDSMDFLKHGMVDGDMHERAIFECISELQKEIGACSEWMQTFARAVESDSGTGTYLRGVAARADILELLRQKTVVRLSEATEELRRINHAFRKGVQNKIRDDRDMTLGVYTKLCMRMIRNDQPMLLVARNPFKVVLPHDPNKGKSRKKGPAKRRVGKS